MYAMAFWLLQGRGDAFFLFLFLFLFIFLFSFSFFFFFFLFFFRVLITRVEAISGLMK